MLKLFKFVAAVVVLIFCSQVLAEEVSLNNNGEKRGQVLKCQLLIANDTRIFFHSHGRCSISTPDPLGFPVLGADDHYQIQV